MQDGSDGDAENAAAVYDGDESRDFIRGLGVAFSVPMREQVHNRHALFSGEGLGL